MQSGPLSPGCLQSDGEQLHSRAHVDRILSHASKYAKQGTVNSKVLVYVQGRETQQKSQSEKRRSGGEGHRGREKRGEERQGVDPSSKVSSSRQK